jgi:hypothetical protein
MESVRKVVTVLAMAVVVSYKDSSEKDIGDAYKRTKALINLRYTKVNLEPLEKRPESKGLRSKLEDELLDAGADQDVELLKEAEGEWGSGQAN